MTASPALATWACEDTASIREGRTLLSCGMGAGTTEEEARRLALRNAAEELHTVCELSRDCSRYHLNVRPLRTDCRRDGALFRCTRGLRAEITGELRPRASGRAEERFSRDFEELERLHEITRRLVRDMTPAMSGAMAAPPAVPEDHTLF
jgi:hypothetical protein